VGRWPCGGAMWTIHTAVANLERPPLATELRGEPPERCLVGDWLRPTFDDQVQRWHRQVPGADDAPCVGSEVPALAGALPRQEMERALDPEGDDWHEVRPPVRRDGGQPVVLA